MQNDFKDSVKARLYDFKYTPFLSAYIFSWVFFNSKLILIFISNTLTVEKKIELLEWSQVNYKTPLIFALIYVFIFPMATALFYAVTLCYKALMNKIQQLIQDKTPLPQQQANAIREENVKLALEHREMIEKLEKIQLDYSSKETTLIQQFSDKERKLSEEIEEKESNLNRKINEIVNKETSDLRAKTNEYDRKIVEKNNEIIEKQNTISKLEHNISELEIKVSKLEPISDEKPLIDKAYKNAKSSKNISLNELTIEHIKILATFFNNDSMMSKSNFKNYANKEFNLSKPIIELRVTELVKKGIIEIDSSFYRINEKGKILLEELFV